MRPPVIADQELVVHCFAPLDGPQAAAAYQQIRQVWLACRERLDMTEPIGGLPVPTMLPEDPGGPGADGLIAAQQNPGGDRQGVLRRVHDVLNLSVGLAQPRPAGPPGASDGLLSPLQFGSGRARASWTDFDRAWANVLGPGAGALLGESRLYLARLPFGPGPDGKAALGQSLDLHLPGRGDRPAGWLRGGTTTPDGFTVWETQPPADIGRIRELVLAAPTDLIEKLSAWAWSDGTPGIPPLGRYLLYESKLRYEARLLESWHRRSPASDVDTAVAELRAVLASGRPDSDRTARLRSWMGRLATERVRLTQLKTDLAHLSGTVASARHNLTSVPGCPGEDGAEGLFAADQELARWLTGQAADDLRYVSINIDQVTELSALVADELSRAMPVSDGQAAGTGLASDAPDVTRKVFVVHGRDTDLTRNFFDLLRSVNLWPLDWETLVKATCSTAPYLGQVVVTAPHLAQATLVLLTPDDLVELHSDLYLDHDSPQERARDGQARPSVLMELGMALMAYQDRTVVVEIGQMRPIADLAGVNTIRFDGSATAVRKVLGRLEQAGCEADLSETGWLEASRFADLAARWRGPATHKAPEQDPRG
jgi:predicted nucleotide-binding protein